MGVTRIKIKASVGDKKVTVPLGQIFDEAGREKLIETWEEVKIQDAVNPINDYETTRYYHNNALNQGNTFYNFEFWDEDNSQYEEFEQQLYRAFLFFHESSRRIFPVLNNCF